MPPIRIIRQSSKYPAVELPLSKTRVRKSQNIACEFPGCTRTFPQRCNYRDHMNVHEGKRPHACPDCESAFANRGGLTRHQKKYHNYLPIRHRSAKKLSTDEKSSSRDVEVARTPSPPPAAPSSSATDGGKKPRWINTFALEGPNSTFPAINLDPILSPSESSASGSSSIYASLLSPPSSWGPTSGDTKLHYDYTDFSSSSYPSWAASSVNQALHYDYSQPLSFASSNPQPTYDFAPPSSSFTFAPTPNYSHWSSLPSHAGQESAFHGNTYSTSEDVLNLDHWNQYQYQFGNPSTLMNYSY
ncbi:hypothetical protein BDZ89DRAFT_1157327 [Hymenopellis radicata]|nr:hypothetical protein BDZ89DRAFT_1157327 [Hymenopellis radicata]